MTPDNMSYKAHPKKGKEGSRDVERSEFGVQGEEEALARPEFPLRHLGLGY